MNISDLDTPVAVVDLDRVEANIVSFSVTLTNSILPIALTSKRTSCPSLLTCKCAPAQSASLAKR